MDNPLAITAGQAGNLYPSTKTPLSLRPGQVIRAVVQDIISEDTVLLQFGNTPIQAKTDLPLNTGQVLFLKVDTLGSEIRLRVTAGPQENDAALVDALLTSLSRLKTLEPAAAGLEKLAGLLHAIPEGIKDRVPELSILGKLFFPIEAFDGDALKKAVIDSGVLFEAKLRIIAEQAVWEGGAGGAQIPGSDLKGVLLAVKDALADSGVSGALRDAGVSTQQLNQTLDKLVGNIELQQIQSKLGDTLQLFLPVLWNELKEEWISFKKTRSNSVDTGYSCTINLELERIGKLRSHVLLQSGRIHIKMICDNPAFVEIMQKHSELLGRQLESAGLKAGGISAALKQNLDFSQDVSTGFDLHI